MRATRGRGLFTTTLLTRQRLSLLSQSPLALPPPLPMAQLCRRPLRRIGIRGTGTAVTLMVQTVPVGRMQQRAPPPVALASQRATHFPRQSELQTDWAYHLQRHQQQRRTVGVPALVLQLSQMDPPLSGTFDSRTRRQ